MGAECSACRKYALFTRDCLTCKRTFCDKCQDFMPCSECRLIFPKEKSNSKLGPWGPNLELKLDLTPNCPSCQTSRSEVHLWPCRECHQFTMCSNCVDQHKLICLQCAHKSASPCSCGVITCEQCGVKCVECHRIIHKKCSRFCCQEYRCLDCDFQHQRCLCGVVAPDKTCAQCQHHICARCSVHFICDSFGWKDDRAIKCSTERNLCHPCFKGCECPNRKFYCEHHQHKCAVCENRTLGSHVQTLSYQCQLCNLPCKIQTCCHHTSQEHLQITDLWQSPTGEIRCPKHRTTCEWHNDSPTIPREGCFKCHEIRFTLLTHLEMLPPPLRQIISEY